MEQTDKVKLCRERLVKNIKIFQSKESLNRFKIMTMTETITPTLDYKVADISLAEFGRKEIS